MGEDNKKALDRMNAVDKILDEYEQKIGLPEFHEDMQNEEISMYFSMNKATLSKLSVPECAEASVLLSGYALYLQRALNRETTRYNWADSVLKELVSGRESNFSGSWESQFNQAAKSDDYTNKLMNIKRYAKNRMDRLNFLSACIKNLADSFTQLQRSKINYG